MSNKLGRLDVDLEGLDLSMSADKILSEAAETFRQRREVYGENYRAVGEAMNALFPDGIDLSTVEDQNRYHILMLVVVKLSRYCVNWSNGGHQDSIHDAAVYCAMLEAIDLEINDNKGKMAS